MKEESQDIFGNTVLSSTSGTPVNNYIPYSRTNGTVLTGSGGTTYDNWSWTTSEDQESPYNIKTTIHHDEILSLDFYVEKGSDGFVFLAPQCVTVVLRDQQKTEFANNPGLFLMKIFKAKNMDPYVRQENSESLYQGYGVFEFIRKHKTKL